MPTTVEIAGFVFGIAGIWLTIKEHWMCFPVGLLNVSISMVLFMDQKLYSDSLQQAVYIVLLSYGWYRWQFPLRSERPVIGYATAGMRLLLALICLLMAALLGLFFDKFTDAEVPYADAAATAMSFVAQFLIARKKIENWWIWIVVNIMYIIIYIYKDLFLYAVLFSVYLVLAFHGLYTWKQSLNPGKLAATNG